MSEGWLKEKIRREMVISDEECMMIQLEEQYQKQEIEDFLGRRVTLSERGKLLFKHQQARDRRRIGIITGKSKTPYCWIIQWNEIKHLEIIHQKFLFITGEG